MENFAACEKTLGGICPLNSRDAQSDPRLGETKTAVNAITETKTMGCYVQCHGIMGGGFWKKSEKQVRSGQYLLTNGDGSVLPDQNEGKRT